MARIAGVNIPTGKRVVIGLQYIHGIGSAKAQEICQKVGIESERRVLSHCEKLLKQNDLSSDERRRLLRLAGEAQEELERLAA